MKQALYRNYRPRTLNEVLGQDHVTKTLQRALKSGRISHAYLFTGPRGVGKTSTARILAHEVNGLTYKDEDIHLDIIEIDAASNRRIDEIRDLRDKIRLAPTAGKYKVYIIDEVHMLTREAFNALLKTLEEPPAHIIFILATTESYKLPETIISRTQRFEFKPISPAQTAKHLLTIAKTENIAIEEPAVKLLAEFGNGSFRDSISLLDQLSASGSKIKEQDVRLMLGLPASQSVNQLAEAAKDGDMARLLDTLQSMKDSGVDASVVAAELSKNIRDALIRKTDTPYAAELLRQLIEVPASPRPYDYLEICLLEATSKNKASPNPPSARQTSAGRPAASKNRTAESAITPKSIVERHQTIRLNIDNWPQIVGAAKQKAASIYTALRLARPELADDILTLKFEFPLHQKKLNQAQNKALVADLIEELTGVKVRVDCIVDKTAFDSRSDYSEPVIAVNPKEPGALNSIHSIFGTAEVVET